MNAPGSLKVIISPYHTLGELATAPRWYIPFFLLCLGTIGASLTIRPFARQATLLSLTSLVDSNELERTLTHLDLWFSVGLILIPLFLYAKIGLFSLFIRALGSSMGRKAELRQIFMVVVWSSFAVLLEGLCNCLVLWVKGTDAIRTPRDLEVPLGLNLLIPCSHPAISGFLGHLNPFEFWFFSLLTSGIARVYSISLARSLLVSTPIWIGRVALQLSLRLIAF